MQDNLPCKNITLDKPEGRRRAGRQYLRCMDGVMRDAERLGVRNWRTKARDRDSWRRLLESAKTLHGLWRLGVSMTRRVVHRNKRRWLPVSFIENIGLLDYINYRFFLYFLSI
jgi:hypothetical protein